MRKSRNIPFKQGSRYAFVVDGECESWYISMLKRNEKHVRIKLSPELSENKKSLNEQYKKVIELSNDYHKVFWILDLDVHIKETRESRNNRIKELGSYFKKLPGNVVTIINTPSLEYWFLLHFKETAKYYDTCAKVITELKKTDTLKDYAKTKTYFTRQNNDIYLRLKPSLPKATKNAQKLPDFDFKNYEIGMSQMNKLFEEIEELNEFIA